MSTDARSAASRPRKCRTETTRRSQAAASAGCGAGSNVSVANSCGGTKRLSVNDTGAEVRAGALKLSRSIRSVADVVAAFEAAAGSRAGTVEAVGEDRVAGRRADVDRVEEEAIEVRRRIGRETPADHDRLSGIGCE